MKRITQIDICNYRAFYNERNNPTKYRVNLPNGENLLIYGENGSGKSSFFKALNEIFVSAKDEGMAIQYNVFSLDDPDLPDAEIKMIISEKVPEEREWNKLPEIILNNSAPTTYDNQILNESSASFLTYRDILNTYFSEIDNHDENPNLFNLIINGLIRNVTDSSTNETIFDIFKEIDGKVSSIEDAVKDIEASLDETDPSKTQLETKGSDVIRDEIVGQINTRIEELNLSITATLDSTLIYVNRYLNEFFNANIEVSIENRDNYLILEDQDGKYLLSKNLKLDLNYYGRGHGPESYQVFLNEARLSALAICLYLAAIKLDQPFEENLKLIFLDDIFIGLDTSNRVPLLKILHKDFSDFQIFITTYDYHWFELAKNWFEHRTDKTWKFFELYSDDYSYTDFELPKLLSTQEPLAQAIYYYKQSDYPASGNYLRRACEKAIKSILPPICLKNNDGLDISELSRLIESSIFFFEVIKEPTLILDNLAVYLQALMNPLSHYDINISIYRKEIKEIEEVITNLMQRDFSKTKFKRILVKNSLVKLTYRVKLRTHNVYEIRLKEDLWIYQHLGGGNISLGEVKCKNENLYEMVGSTKGQIFHCNIESSSLRTFYENMVGYENEKTPKPNIKIRPDYENLYEYDEGNGTWHNLNDLIHF